MRPRLRVIQGDAVAAEHCQRLDAQIRTRKLKAAALRGLLQAELDAIARLEAERAPSSAPPEAG